MRVALEYIFQKQARRRKFRTKSERRQSRESRRHEYSNILPSQAVYHVAGGWRGSTKCRKRDVSNMPSKCVPAKQSRAA